jgi:hypothetical protein
MIIYVYETVPQKPGAKTRYYKIRQNPGDAPLTIHPETAEPIRRVVLGELGELTLPGRERSAEDQTCSPSSCGCGRLPWLR